MKTNNKSASHTSNTAKTKQPTQSSLWLLGLAFAAPLPIATILIISALLPEENQFYAICGAFVSALAITILSIRGFRRSHDFRRAAFLAIAFINSSLLLLALLHMIGFVITGGIHTTFSKPSAPDPQSTRLSELRDETNREITASFDTVDYHLRMKPYATAMQNTCSKGHSDIKGGDPFAHRCTYRTVQLYGFDNNPVESIKLFDDAFLRAGWSTSDDKLEQATTSIRAWRPQASHNPSDQPACDILRLDEHYRHMDLSVSFLTSERGRCSPNQLNQEVYSTSSPGITFYDNHHPQSLTGAYTKIDRDHRYTHAIIIEKVYFKQ